MSNYNIWVKYFLQSTNGRRYLFLVFPFQKVIYFPTFFSSTVSCSQQHLQKKYVIKHFRLDMLFFHVNGNFYLIDGWRWLFVPFQWL